ncbi:hypothetical protein A1D23_00405 [Chelonobacter oris]|uniref:Cell-division protein ZapC C-terminal domain-containing protein n=1 Tax=Chelonobacter oris TaxID=505317 RepID=A0A0A3BCF9_9PAST|nr:cell division protein ZapC domain-containing protein [Chelonobacter oris]KGQ71209.1 hypothetical protein OA57_02995 [Chelonobacter oris]MDH3000029.1 hypothetical protein [Chelonobacter oris]
MNGFFYWTYDNTADCLMLCSETTNRKIRTALQGSMLNPSAYAATECEADEFIFYTQIEELIEHCDLIMPQQRELLAYTAVAARTFLLPTQPKSWFFETTESDGPHAAQPYPYLVQTRLKQTQQVISLLSFAGDDTVADCLLLEEELNLPGLQLKFGQPLRIFVNRLQYLAAADYASEPYWQQQSA